MKGDGSQTWARGPLQSGRKALPRTLEYEPGLIVATIQRPITQRRRTRRHAVAVGSSGNSAWAIVIQRFSICVSVELGCGGSLSRIDFGSNHRWGNKTMFKSTYSCQA